MSKEYTVWGKSSKNPDDEAPLATQLPSLEAAKRAEQILIKKHGCFDTRIQTIDFNDDLANTFRKLV